MTTDKRVQPGSSPCDYCGKSRVMMEFVFLSKRKDFGKDGKAKKYDVAICIFCIREIAKRWKDYRPLRDERDDYMKHGRIR